MIVGLTIVHLINCVPITLISATIIPYSTTVMDIRAVLAMIVSVSTVWQEFVLSFLCSA